MEHNEATDTLAAERYVLREMNETERDAFEEHYFGCATCADDVKHGAALSAGIRSQRAAASPAGSRAAVAWLAVAASLALITFLGFQNAQLRRDRDAALQPRVLRSYSLLGAGSRSGTSALGIADAKQPFTLYVDIPPEPAATSYRAEIVSAAGAVRASYAISAGDAKDTVQLLVPGGKLAAGDYKLIIRGGGSAEVASYPFTVK